jgi:DNA polymerase V|tara:strand:- start:130 stop:534 length:405 start_codon:yes stop_codon:yes gene_type:complete
MKINEKLPIILQKVCAGFPSPATDYLEDEINLNEELVTNKASTFLIRVTGSSMVEDNIHDGDVLIVDKSLNIQHNSIAVLNYEGQLVVKKIIKKNNKFFLISKLGNHNHFIEITEDNETQVWGVVTYVIHKVKK